MVTAHVYMALINAPKRRSNEEPNHSNHHRLRHVSYLDICHCTNGTGRS
jgi:hypothetical protein